MTPHTLRLPLRPSRRALFLLGLASLALPAVAAAQPAAAAAPASSQAAAVDAVVEKAMQTRQFPAASIAVVKDGTVVLSKGYGLAKLGDRGSAPRPTRWFRDRLGHQDVHGRRPDDARRGGEGPARRPDQRSTSPTCPTPGRP